MRELSQELVKAGIIEEMVSDSLPDGEIMEGEEEEAEAEVVGQKIFLPNIIFKLVRNHTPAGQPYNPYEATFRVPPSVTKTDVRAYLLAVYGVVLVLVGLFGGDEQATKADGVNINLWAGLGMIVAAAAFGLWTRVRPTVVEDPDEPQDAPTR